MKYTDKQIEDLISGVYAGKVTVDNLPEDLYLAIGDHLEDGIIEGWGGLADNIQLGAPDVPLYNALRDNVYIFSAAKTYQQIREMAEFIAESPNYTNFKLKALATYDEYNVNWLKAEYNTAVGQAHQANQWKRIQDTKDVFPYLRYSAVIDSKTSEICRPLEGVTLPVDDPFWDNYAPLNHFNCRCTLEKIDKYEDVNITRKDKIAELNKELGETVNDEFRMNSGKDGYIFDPKSHPYFKVAPKDKGLAKENFNLPIPPPIEPKVTPTVKPDATEVDERLKQVKRASKELHESGAGKTYKDAKKSYKEALDESNDLVTETNKLYKSKGFDHPDAIEARKKAMEAIEKRKALLVEKDKAAKVYEDEVTKILESRHAPSKFNLGASKAQYKSIDRLKAADEAFRSIVGEKVLGENVSIGVKTLKPNSRAFFRGAENSISVTRAEDIGTITHELGHGLEYHNADYFDKVKKYYGERTEGYDLKLMRDATGNKNYGFNEKTKEDKFRDAYTGKWYANLKGEQRATELTSMWFSEAYEDLERFIETDPDYFDHFYKLFNE